MRYSITTRIRRILLTLLIASLLVGCDNPTTKENDKRKTWVYLTVTYDTTDGEITNYLYGKITQKDLHNIKTKSNSEELFEISESRYIDDDGMVIGYQEDNETGTFYYRLKNVVYMEILQSDPINTKVEIND